MRVLLFFGGIILSTLIATLAVAPLAAFHFHKSQQFAILANLIAIPLCNIVVMPAALATLMLMPFGLEALPLWIMGLGIDGMNWCARQVAALPGAVGWIPAMSLSGFVCMVAGGLWLTLWRRRWRLLGLAPIAAGVALAPTERFADVLVGGKDGTLVGVRSTTGRLEALSIAGSQYELSRWLENDGDSRPARSAATGAGYRCDPAGCTTRVKGKLIAIPRHPAALADDCRNADILLLRWPRDGACTAKGVVVDYFDVRRDSTHALFIDGDHVTIRTVAEDRGNRPWSAPGAERNAVPSIIQHSRLAQFAVPGDLLGSGVTRPMADVDDEDALPVPGREPDE